MPRRTQVNYYKSRGGYMCQINRKQYMLAKGPDDAPRGPTYLAALDAYRDLVDGLNVEKAGDDNTVRTVLETYLQSTGGEVEDSTQDRRVVLLKPFVTALGNVRVSALTPLQLEGFIADMRRPRKVQVVTKGVPKQRTVFWGDSTVSSFLRTASAAFAWAIERRLITTNPCKGIRKPGIRSRGADCVISPEQHQTFLRLCRSAGMRQIMIALENTGARPGEIVAAEARYWDAGKQALVYLADARRKKGAFRSKAAKHKDRIIYFSGDALTLIQELMRKYPTGPLFRKRNGKPYSEGAIQFFFSYFRERKAVQMPELTAYSYRHTFATRWLLAGRSIEILAELLGNTPEVIRKHYAHLCGDWQAIRQQLEAFEQQQAEDNPPLRLADLHIPEPKPDVPPRRDAL
jgi:integrase